MCSSLPETFFIYLLTAEAVEFTLVCLHYLLIRKANEDKMQITNTSCQDKNKNKELLKEYIIWKPPNNTNKEWQHNMTEQEVKSHKGSRPVLLVPSIILWINILNFTVSWQ